MHSFFACIQTNRGGEPAFKEPLRAEYEVNSNVDVKIQVGTLDVPSTVTKMEAAQGLSIPFWTAAPPRAQRHVSVTIYFTDDKVDAFFAGNL